MNCATVEVKEAPPEKPPRPKIDLTLIVPPLAGILSSIGLKEIIKR